MKSGFPVAARRLRLVAILAAAVCLTGCDVLNLISFSNSPPGTTTTLVLVRHAERDPGLDPPLNAEGQNRAQILRDVLSERGVNAIFAPELIRNMQTAEPLAQTLGITVQPWIVANYVNTAAFADAVVDDILANHAGRRSCSSGTLVPPASGRPASTRNSTNAWAGRPAAESLSGHVHRRYSGFGRGSLDQDDLRSGEQPRYAAVARGSDFASSVADLLRARRALVLNGSVAANGSFAKVT